MWLEVGKTVLVSAVRIIWCNYDGIIFQKILPCYLRSHEALASAAEQQSLSLDGVPGLTCFQGSQGQEPPSPPPNGPMEQNDFRAMA